MVGCVTQLFGAGGESGRLRHPAELTRCIIAWQLFVSCLTYMLCLTLGLNTHVSLELDQKDAKLNFKHENKLRVAGRGDHWQNPDNSDFARRSGLPRPRLEIEFGALLAQF